MVRARRFMDGRFWCVILVAALVAPWALPAQRVSSERGKLPPRQGEAPASVLRIENLKGTLKEVDLKKRTVTVTHASGEETFTFPTAAGREKVSLSKKVAREVGKKSLRLEDIQTGCKVKVSYYPTLGTIMELLVEELPR